MPASRRQKIVFWSVFTPLALIAILVIVILTFDWNRVKPWLNDKVSQAIGRPFAINGDLMVTWKRAQGETGWRTLVPWPRLSACLLYTSPSPRDGLLSRMPSSA